jgi:hypothetical protein
MATKIHRKYEAENYFLSPPLSRTKFRVDNVLFACKAILASMITSKPAIDDHPKTGQRSERGK